MVLVSIVIIALIVYVLTIEKIRSIATLKLIGAPNSVIVRLILTQSLLLTLGGFALVIALSAIGVVSLFSGLMLLMAALLLSRLLTLGEARDKAAMLRQLAKAGLDPMAERDRDRTANALGSAGYQIGFHQSPWPSDH